MTTRSQALHKLQAYANKIQETEYVTSSPGEKEAYQNRIDAAFEELSERVQTEKTALEELKAKAGDVEIEPSVDTNTRIRQLQVIKAAYDDLTQSEPDLPFPDSPLPALLAVRSTQKLISETKVAISDTHEKVINARQRLDEETKDLGDACLIKDALENRIARLKVEVDKKSQKTPDEVSKDMTLEQKTRKQFYEKDTRRLVKALVKFINDHLAAMLAAEELGGPVVGDLLDVSDEMLEAGFSQKGTAKKPKPKSSNSDVGRQQRIDQLWGPADQHTDDRTERQAAAAEMRLLVENLLNVAAEEGAGTYFQIPRDSAASRFLVRAKVAQFHPRDARKLRLIDFARELDD